MSFHPRTVLSKKSPYYISSQRFSELRYFCLQYHEFKNNDPYDKRVKMIDKAAEEASDSLKDYILLGVTNDYSYEYLRMSCNIPCARRVYYRHYRKFFWLLDQARDR